MFFRQDQLTAGRGSEPVLDASTRQRGRNLHRRVVDRIDDLIAVLVLDHDGSAVTLPLNCTPLTPDLAIVRERRPVGLSKDTEGVQALLHALPLDQRVLAKLLRGLRARLGQNRTIEL